LRTEAKHIDVSALTRKLRQHIRGEVRFDDGSRALYATDGSNYRQVPIGVLIPRDAQDVAQAVSICRDFGAPLVARGAGTSLAGQCCNVAVVLDFSKYIHRILDLDVRKRRARVEPGLICDHLIAAVKRHNLTWAPAPATHQWATFGGMIGNNSCGTHSQWGGRTQDNIEEMEVLTYRGDRFRVGPTSESELTRIIREGGPRGRIYAQLKSLRGRYAERIRECYPKIPRRVSGFNLNELLPEKGFHVARALVGSEGTCVNILEATVRLTWIPPARTLLVLGFDDIFLAGDHIAQVAAHRPLALEGMDRRFIRGMEKKRLHLDKLAILPEANGYLLAEFGGETNEESAAAARELMEEMRQQPGAPVMKLIDDPAQLEAIWIVRDSGLGATAFVPGEQENHEGWEDSAIPPEHLGDYLRDLRQLLNQYGYHGSLYGHFGQGCVHTRIDFDLKTAEGIRRFHSFIHAAGDLIVHYDGSLSGEHGDGQSRAELLPKLYGEELVRAFEEFKAIWDPDWKMNPGKVVRPYRIIDNLRYGVSHNPPAPQTHFKFPADGGSFAHATARCVGVGQCRRMENGTMCPSFMVTREEMHTTRGRARLLFEMLQGDSLCDGWRNETVKEALDLCLACKGCKADCPVNVDVATYKAEFLSHYYHGRIRPRHAYAFGLIHVWARLASATPKLANFFAQNRFFGGVGKRLAGVAPERRLPLFAPHTFQNWFAARPFRNEAKPPVMLWPDTFNNFFHPHVAQSAVEVLEAAGFHVVVPRMDLCCGRPLYDFGMLDTAKRWLRQILQALRPAIQAGTPLVVLEPSCCAVFRDEMVNLMPHNQDALRLKQQTFTLAEFLRKHAPGFPARQLDRVAMVQTHCHHGAIMKMECDKALMRHIGLRMEMLDTGCCGMAGAFGFEKGDHYDVSVKCAERVLLPAIRRARPGTLIIADGFSCQEQIRQLASRDALHLAQVLQLALREGTTKPRRVMPDRTPRREPQSAASARDIPVRERPGKSMALAGAGIALAGSAGVMLWRLRKKNGGD
jgi:FAD/FMN-containing dehydrogenase/Fe-S oxidoreductase